MSLAREAAAEHLIAYELHLQIRQAHTQPKGHRGTKKLWRKYQRAQSRAAKLTIKALSQS